jgi:alpha-L-fucosidase
MMTTWKANPRVEKPWYEVEFRKEKAFNTVVIADKTPVTIRKYKLEYRLDGIWKTLFSGENAHKIKIHRFDTFYGDKVRIQIENTGSTAEIAEFAVFNERR